MTRRLLLCRRNGRFTGFPVLGVKWQRMESAGLRSSYGLNAPLKGVLIRSIWPTSPLAQAARPDDIIMRFDGVQVACDGTVPFRQGNCYVRCSISWHFCFAAFCIRVFKQSKNPSRLYERRYHACRHCASTYQAGLSS